MTRTSFLVPQAKQTGIAGYPEAITGLFFSDGCIPGYRGFSRRGYTFGYSFSPV
jgi:hypothetical protein